ncbi:MAG TPA: hypothetical protein VLE43_06240 [Candidatus Saccharimonadia bacterium]|nr:hypothetical protein [Candidatus Saccharimonadia bacterium]
MLLFDLLRIALTRAPKLIEAPLGERIEELCARLPSLSESEEPSDWLDCTDYRLESDDYVFHATAKDGVVVAVIHDTDRHREGGMKRVKKMMHLLKVYAGASDFEQILDNGFGFTYRSVDGKRMATYSYACDVFSVYEADLQKGE